VPDLSISSVKINSRAYTIASTSTIITPTTTTKKPNSTNTGSNVGVIIGCVIGALFVIVLILGSVWFYRAHRGRNEQRHLIKNQDNDLGFTESDQMNAHTTESDMKNSSALPIWWPTLFPSLLSSKKVKKASSFHNNRPPSPSCSITITDPNKIAHRDHLGEVIHEMNESKLN
jgi:hypothetical protein